MLYFIWQPYVGKPTSRLSPVLTNTTYMRGARRQGKQTGKWAWINQGTVNKST